MAAQWRATGNNVVVVGKMGDIGCCEALFTESYPRNWPLVAEVDDDENSCCRCAWSLSLREHRSCEDYSEIILAVESIPRDLWQRIPRRPTSPSP